MKFYVYLLRDPRPGKDLQPIYVGKGKGDRARRHWYDAENHPNSVLRRVFNKIRQAGLKPRLETVGYFDVEADAFQLEIELIAKYGRRDLEIGTLCNLTDGGEGGSGCLASRERMRKRHADPECAKAYVERMRKTICRLNADPEFVKASAKRMYQRHADPEFIRARVNGWRERQNDLDYAKVNAERTRKYWTDPESRAQRCAAMSAGWAKRRAIRAAQASLQYTGAGP